MNVRINFRDGLTPLMRSMAQVLRSSGWIRAAGAEMQETIAEHMFQLNGKKNKLGGKPSDYFAKAARLVEKADALTVSEREAVVTIKTKGFSRAFRDVKIVPSESKSLAIPIHKDAYNIRARELWQRMKLFIPEGADYIAANIGGSITPMYVLCRSVTQKQDRSLLPDDDELRAAAVFGAEAALSRAAKRGGHF